MSIKVKINNDWVDTNIKAVRGVNRVNSEDVYTKEETEKKFATKTEVQTQINNSITKENIENIIGEVYTKAESDAMLATKQNVLTAGNGITIANDVISVDAIPVDDKKFTVYSNPRNDEFVTTFENYGYNDDGTQKTSGSSFRSWVFKIGNYGHKKVYFTSMNAWMCDGLDDAQNMINPTLLGKSSGNVNIGEEHIGKYIVAMTVSGYVGYGSPYGRCVMFCDDKTQSELYADERMLSEMYAGNLMRYAVATSSISDTPTLEWGDGAELRFENKRNIFLDSVYRPNIVYECNVEKKLHYIYQGCGRLRDITPIWDTSLVTTMLGAFNTCLSLERADLSHLNLSSVTDVSYMFYNCIVLREVKMASLQAATNCQYMFYNCTSLQSVTFPELPSVTSCYQMFNGCSSLQSVTPLSLPSVTNCSSMFYGCSSLQSVTFQSLQSVTSSVSMFDGCSSLKSITIPELPAVTSCQYMFSGCLSLQSMYLDMPNCENFEYSFYRCDALHTVELVDVRKAKGLVNSFYFCSSLQNITCVEELPKCNISFSYSSKLTLESVTNIITHLPDLSAEDSKTLTLHATTKSLLTEALIAEATNKNWIIA